MTVLARDGCALSAQVITAETTAKGVLIVHSAAGVPRRFYLPFAKAAAKEGFQTVLYDYRGIGRSRPADLRRFRARMRDWALLDGDAVTAWALGAFPRLPIVAIGHSMGGHVIGLADSTRHLAGAVLVASPAGSLRFVEPFVERVKATLILRMVFPALAFLFGYVPCRRLGWGEDLPRGVAREWGYWAGLSRYFFDDPSLSAACRFQRVVCPVLVIGVADDKWATRNAVDLLSSFLTSARVGSRIVEPTAGSKVGHLGFFRVDETRWQATLSWITDIVMRDTER